MELVCGFAVLWIYVGIRKVCADVNCLMFYTRVHYSKVFGYRVEIR